MKTSGGWTSATLKILRSGREKVTSSTRANGSSASQHHQETPEEEAVVRRAAHEHPPDHVAKEQLDERGARIQNFARLVHHYEGQRAPEDREEHQCVDRGDPDRGVGAEPQHHGHGHQDQIEPVRRHPDPDVERARDEHDQEEQPDRPFRIGPRSGLGRRGFGGRADHRDGVLSIGCTRYEHTRRCAPPAGGRHRAFAGPWPAAPPRVKSRGRHSPNGACPKAGCARRSGRCTLTVVGSAGGWPLGVAVTSESVHAKSSP